MKYKIVLNLVVYFLSLRAIYELICQNLKTNIYIYNAFQNKKDFDGEDIATNYPPRDGSVIPLSSCNFSHEMGPYAWGSKSYGF
jgi:hypothetical protein